MKKGLVILGLLGALYTCGNAWDFTWETSKTLYRPQFQDCSMYPRPGIIQDILDGVKNGSIHYKQGKVVTFQNGTVGYYNQLEVKAPDGKIMLMHTFDTPETCEAVAKAIGLPLNPRNYR